MRTRVEVCAYMLVDAMRLGVKRLVDKIRNKELEHKQNQNNYPSFIENTRTIKIEGLRSKKCHSYWKVLRLKRELAEYDRLV